ncbi:hypothetical protein IAQ61_004031, partial [Plenodomus lingam]|uniref:uncharacterized protein n=1 Tax=Leptosphaeria maculans TaxID=5022 RepID=UPI0033253696
MLFNIFLMSVSAILCLCQGALFSRGQKFQIILLGIPDVAKMPLPPTDTPIWDIDLFDSPASTIQSLKRAGKIVICYFSAGTGEDWRIDYKDFAAADLGKVLPLWPNEKWVRTGSPQIRKIMAKRIRLAAEKGCDAIDPDNIADVSQQNDNGLNLKNTDAIAYMQWMHDEAAKYNMQIGLKNSLDILNNVSSIIDFAVNEQCAQLGECSAYKAFLISGKPVFQIEYPQPLNGQAVNGVSCKGPGIDGLSTILKDLTLNGIAYYCDGSFVDTPTLGGTSPPRPSPPPSPSPTRPTSTPPRSSSAPPKPSTPTSRPSTTREPIPTPSTPGGGGGCRAKHWDQCGGKDWKGCTICETRRGVRFSLSSSGPALLAQT